MRDIRRRDFLRNAFAGVALSPLLAENVKEGIFRKSEGSLEKIAAYDDTEDYWNFVKESFSFEDGLFYFNNGSLGPSPEFVIDATEQFRRMLDAFPSKYMWGGWNSEKEEVRKKTAVLFKL